MPRVHMAVSNGALRCAPVELAMAEAHNDFAKEALSQGNYFPAKREACLLYTSPSPRDGLLSRMPSSA